MLYMLFLCFVCIFLWCCLEIIYGLVLMQILLKLFLVLAFVIMIKSKINLIFFQVLLYSLSYRSPKFCIKVSLTAYFFFFCG